MRACWVDAGNDPDWAKVARERMTALFFDHRDPRVTRTYLQNIKTAGYAPGIYACWNWPEYEGKSAREQAETFSIAINAVSWSETSAPKAQWNDERHEPAKVIGVLEHLRFLQRRRDLSWTLEGMQGGWMDGLFASEVKALKIRVVPQCYNGEMTQIWDSLAITRDLTKRGFPDALVSPMYDAGALPHYWDGFAFTQGRLP